MTTTTEPDRIYLTIRSVLRSDARLLRSQAALRGLTNAQWLHELLKAQEEAK